MSSIHNSARKASVASSFSKHAWFLEGFHQTAPGARDGLVLRGPTARVLRVAPSLSPGKVPDRGVSSAYLNDRDVPMQDSEGKSGPVPAVRVD